MKILTKAFATFAALFICTAAFAQNRLSATLVDSSTGEPVGFATVSLTRTGEQKPAKYVLSAEDGSFKIEGVRAASYTLKAELMGYKAYTREMQVKGAMDLGEIRMDPDRQMLDAAKVSATGNPIIIKKDTIEYNATSFKTTDNDVLEDLLKKLPGVEVDESGSITVNGQTINKITIDGKTFFLDDPQLASKNIPAKIVNKLKVIEKKSEQAEFTGIDDGEEEHVIDLSIKPGMMKGAFGNVMAGGGHDVPSTDVQGDFRYQGAAFVGKFTDKTQLSLILNANNTNNRGFNDLSGSMMGNMRGGGGGMGRGQGGWGNGNGITTSYMGGVNGAWDLFDDKMNLGANYLYNYTDKEVEEQSKKTTYLGDHNLIYDSEGTSSTVSGGHRLGMRLEHKFSENTSILFQPQINFGTGSYAQSSDVRTSFDRLDGSAPDPANVSTIDNTGANRNFNASGFFLFRQRLGIPGRTLTAMTRFSFSNNDLTGVNRSDVTSYEDDPKGTLESVNQNFNNNQHTSSIFGRVTYTEPLGHNFYVEANYAYNWNKSTSDKETFDVITGAQVYEYSNSIINESGSQTIGANLMYQNEKSRFQLGASAVPTVTRNNTTRYNASTGRYEALEPYERTVWKWSPQAMVWWEISENANTRMFYRGSSAQPSINKLMPVPDNTDPLNISFGNPSLNPYFSHNLRGDFRYNNKSTFTSVNVNFNGGFVQDPIVSAIWYGNDGAQYSMPFNGPSSANAGVNMFANIPVAKSNFSVSNMARVSWNRSSSYVGTDIDMSKYVAEGYYEFMKDFIAKFNDPAYFAAHIAENTTSTVSFMERLRLTYRSDNLELQVSGRTRGNKSWYTLSTMADKTMTWNNQIRAGVNWTLEQSGTTFKSDYNFNWYNGYSTAQPSEHVLNAEINQLVFDKKVTIGLKGYDILGQAKNLFVSDNENYHTETVNNTLGRYIILSVTYRFGTFDRSKMGGRGMGGHGMGGPHGGRR